MQFIRVFLPLMLQLRVRPSILLITPPALMALLFHSLRAASPLVARYATFDAIRVAVVGFEGVLTFAALSFVRQLVGE